MTRNYTIMYKSYIADPGKQRLTQQTYITNGILLKLYTLNKTSTFSPEKYNASSSKFWGKTFCSYYVFSPKDI